MKQFFLTMAGVFAGLTLFFVGLPIVLIAMIAASARPAPPPSNTILSLDLRGPISDQSPHSPLAFLNGRSLSVASIVQGLHQAETDTHVKALLVRFSQSLHLETQGTGVHVTALCPGFTYSEFHDVNGTRDAMNGLPAWLWLGADEVAAIGYEAAEANRAVSVSGSPNKAIAALAKILPDDWALAVMARQSRRFRRI